MAEVSSIGAYGQSILAPRDPTPHVREDRKSTRLNSSHSQISYAVFCLKKKKDDDERFIQHDGAGYRHVRLIARTERETPVLPESHDICTGRTRSPTAVGPILSVLVAYV